MASTLQQLANIITSGISNIDPVYVYDVRGIPYPDLHNGTASETEDIPYNEDIARTKSLVIAACGHLIASLQAPAQTLTQSAASVSAPSRIAKIFAF
jgi:hypothetical protein